MGLFQRSAKEPPSLNVDPFALFAETEVSLGLEPMDLQTSETQGAKQENTAPRDTATRLPTRESSWTGVMMFAGVIVLSIAAGWALLESGVFKWQAEEATLFAYFELRVVDPTGKPVAGAVIKNGSKKIGTTDTYGEWRRFLKVPVGSSLNITAAKKMGSANFVAVKNFAVPMEKPSKGDVELKASVQLVPEGGAADQHVARVTENKENSPRVAAVAAAPAPATQTAAVETAEVSASAPEKDGGSDFTEVWFSAADHQVASRNVLTAVTQRARELGMVLRQGAQWQVQITHLVDRRSKDDPGALMVEMSYMQSGAQKNTAFLRNYLEDDRQTARAVLWGLQQHSPKAFTAVKGSDGRYAVLFGHHPTLMWGVSPRDTLMSKTGETLTVSSESFSNAQGQRGFWLEASPKPACAGGENSCSVFNPTMDSRAPHAGWQRLRLKTTTALEQDTKLFVAGYQARSVGQNMFDYWGQVGSRTNVTLIRDRKVLQRLPMISSAQTPPLVAIPVASVVKRHP